MLRPELVEALWRERFLREIRLAASLTHPNILPFHDSGDADGVLWFTMPLVEGDTLRDRLEREGRLAENAAALPYTAQLRALLAAVSGRREEALEILATVDESALDGHHTFHLAESYAVAGAHERAVALLDRAVTLGFYPHDYYSRLCPFHDALRGRDDFARVAARAAERSAAFRA